MTTVASNLEHNEAPNGGAATVLTLLRRQRDLYRRLHRLADRQHGLIAESDPGTLLTVLGDRQKLVESLLEVGRELAPHRETWAETRQALDDQDREEAEGILAEVCQILGQVIDADEQDARLLSARKVHGSGALQSLRSDREAVSAYAAGARQSVCAKLSEES